MTFSRSRILAAALTVATFVLLLPFALMSMSVALLAVAHNSRYMSLADRFLIFWRVFSSNVFADYPKVAVIGLLAGSVLAVVGIWIGRQPLWSALLAVGVAVAIPYINIKYEADRTFVLFMMTAIAMKVLLCWLITRLFWRKTA